MSQKIELTKKLLPVNFTEKELTTHLALWWRDPRDKPYGGLWLTTEGFNALLEADIKSYRIKFDDDIPPTNQLIILLNRYINCPFYVTQKEAHVFSENMAIQLVLFSGNIERFVRAKANLLKS
jgi:hypothetical protein